MELLLKNARGVKLIFRDDLEKGSETEEHVTIVYSFDLESDWNFFKY